MTGCRGGSLLVLVEGEKRVTSGRIPIHLGFIGRPGPSNDPCRHRHLLGTCMILLPHVCAPEADMGFLHRMFIFCAIAHKPGVPSGVQRLRARIRSHVLGRHGLRPQPIALLPMVPWNAQQTVGCLRLSIANSFPACSDPGSVSRSPAGISVSLAGRGWRGYAAPIGHALGATALSAATIRLWIRP